MAVETTDNGNLFSGNLDANTILKMAMAGGNMDGLFGNNNGNGLIGGLILGSLLRNNGNLFGSDGSGVRSATPTDVQNTVGFINTVQDINSARRDIFQSEGNIQAAISAASNQANIQDLQGQIALLNAINSSTSNIGNAIDTVNQNISDHSASVERSITNSTAQSNAGFANIVNALTAGFAGVNSGIAASTYQLSSTTRDDGDKTRAAIQALSDKISAQEIADLQRQLGVAQTAVLESNLDSRLAQRSRETEVNVTNNINQNSLMQQQQQQQYIQTGLLQQLIGEIQRNNQSIVNLGSMTGNTQAATNVRT